MALPDGMIVMGIVFFFSKQRKAEVKEDLEKLLNQNREESSVVKKENSILKGDIVQLKKKLIRLIK